MAVEDRPAEGSLPTTPDFLKSETWYLYNIESDPGELEDRYRRSIRSSFGAVCAMPCWLFPDAAPLNSPRTKLGTRLAAGKLARLGPDLRSNIRATEPGALMWNTRMATAARCLRPTSSKPVAADT